MSLRNKPLGKLSPSKSRGRDSLHLRPTVSFETDWTPSYRASRPSAISYVCLTKRSFAVPERLARVRRFRPFDRDFNLFFAANHHETRTAYEIPTSKSVTFDASRIPLCTVFVLPCSEWSSSLRNILSQVGISFIILVIVG